MVTKTDPKTEPDTDPDDKTRSIIREELSKMLFTEGESASEGDPGEPEPDEDEDEEGLTLRQITARALKLTTRALEKIPGGKTDAQADAEREIKEPAPEKVPAQVSRGLRFLGFNDPE